MPEQTYPARIYRPRHKRQRLRDDAGRLIGCTDTCCAMYADAVSFGAINVSESWVRRHSTEPTPDPDSPGLNLPQIIEVCRNDLQITMRDGSGLTWARMVTLLNENRRIVAQLWYGDLPGGTNVGHAVLLQARRARAGGPAGYELLTNDPMRSTASWIVDDHLKRAMETFGRRTGLPAGQIRFAYSDVLPYVAFGAD